MGWVEIGRKSFSISVKGGAQKGSFDVFVNPTTVQVGGAVKVVVKVQNPNPFSTQFAITVDLFGSKQSKTITVSAGSSGSVDFTFTAPNQPGTYTGSVLVTMYVPPDYIPPM